MKNNNYTSTILKDLQIEELPLELQEEIIDRIGEVIFQSMITYAMPKMKEADQITLLDYLDKDKNFVDLLEFIESKVHSTKNLVIKEIGKIKKSAKNK